MAVAKKDNDLIKRIGELVIKEFSDFKRYLGHDIQLEHLFDVRVKEYWSKVEAGIKEEIKDNGRTADTTADA